MKTETYFYNGRFFGTQNQKRIWEYLILSKIRERRFLIKYIYAILGTKNFGDNAVLAVLKDVYSAYLQVMPHPKN